MGRRVAEGSEERFAAYVEEVASIIGHADRMAPLEAYCIGLMLPCERKSVEPMAALTAPERVSAQHQSLLHFISQGGLVGRGGPWQGARDGGATDGTARAD
jgi:SRSO17 transposase